MLSNVRMDIKDSDEPVTVTDLLCGRGGQNGREDRVCVRCVWWWYDPRMSWSCGWTVYIYYAFLAEYCCYSCGRFDVILMMMMIFLLNCKLRTITSLSCWNSTQNSNTQYIFLLLPLLVVIITIFLLDGVRSTVILVRIQHNIVARNRAANIYADSTTSLPLLAAAADAADGGDGDVVVEIRTVYHHHSSSSSGWTHISCCCCITSYP